MKTYLFFIFLAIVAFLGIALFEPVFQTYGGETRSQSDAIVLIPFILLLIPVVMTLATWLKSAVRKQKDTADGVVAAWYDARITQTELINGYKANAARYPLAGLVAVLSTSSAETQRVIMATDGQILANSKKSDFRVHLTIQGPHARLVYTSKNHPSLRMTLRSKKFAERLNTMSRQLQATPAARVPALPQPAPGWYPNPTGTPGQSYWDGQAWHNRTQT